MIKTPPTLTAGSEIEFDLSGTLAKAKVIGLTKRANFFKTNYDVKLGRKIIQICWNPVQEIWCEFSRH